MASDYEIAFARGFAESLAKRVGELEERVGKLERIGAPSKPSLTDSGRIVVDANEFERLKRIEKAAWEYILEFEAFELNSDQTRLKIFNRKFEELREALKR